MMNNQNSQLPIDGSHPDNLFHPDNLCQYDMCLNPDNLHPDMAKKIIKDFKLPFNYVNPIQFAVMVKNMLEVAPEFTDAVDMMMDICCCLGIDKDDQPQFCGYIREITDAMVEHILHIHNTGYQAFNQRDINAFFPVEQQNIPTGDNYNYENAGKRFISIDLKNAAFQAMKTWDRIYGKQHGYLIGSLIDDYKTFVAYVVNNCGFAANHNKSVNKLVIDYISTCKSLRQVIFGKTNPKRIMHIEKFIMQTVVKLIKSNMDIIPVRFNNDEVVYEYNESLERALYADEMLSSLDLTITNPVSNQTSTFHVPMEFHKNLYTLEEYSLIQHDDLVPIEHKRPIKFYVKNNVSMLTHTKLAPDFKGLPSQVYLTARALFEGKMKLAHFFETQPILMDGTFHWLAIPTCPCHPEGDDVDINTWELRCNPHNPSNE